MRPGRGSLFKPTNHSAHANAPFAPTQNIALCKATPSPPRRRLAAPRPARLNWRSRLHMNAMGPAPGPGSAPAARPRRPPRCDAMRRAERSGAARRREQRVPRWGRAGGGGGQRVPGGKGTRHGGGAGAARNGAPRPPGRAALSAWRALERAWRALRAQPHVPRAAGNPAPAAPRRCRCRAPRVGGDGGDGRGESPMRGGTAVGRRRGAGDSGRHRAEGGRDGRAEHEMKS